MQESIFALFFKR